MSTKFNERSWRTSIKNGVVNKITALIAATENRSITKENFTTTSTVVDLTTTQKNPSDMRPIVNAMVTALTTSINAVYYGLYRQASRNVPHSDIHDGKYYETLLEAINVLIDKGFNIRDMVFELHPAAYACLAREGFVNTRAPHLFEDGDFDTFFGIPVYVNPNVVREMDDLGNVAYKCLLHTRNGIEYGLSEGECVLNSDNTITTNYEFGANVKDANAVVLIDSCIPF